MSSAQVQWMFHQQQGEPSSVRAAGESAVATESAATSPPPRSERPSFIRPASVHQGLQWLASIGAPGGLRASVEMGRVVAELLDSGYSFRRLAAQPGVASSATLFRTVRLYRLSRIIEGFESFEHVGVGHASCVLTLAVPDQKRLLTAAESERWNRARLRAEARRVRAASE